MTPKTPFWQYVTNEAGEQEFQINQPFIAGCSCPGMRTSVDDAFKQAGVAKLSYLIPAANPALKKYLQDKGYYDAIPEMRSGTFAILINPKTKKFVQISRAVKDETLFNSIREVARHE